MSVQGALLMTAAVFGGVGFVLLIASSHYYIEYERHPIKRKIAIAQIVNGAVILALLLACIWSGVQS